MLALKVFLLGIFLLDILTEKGFCSQFFKNGDVDYQTIEDAKSICEVYNLTLPILETKKDYEDYWHFVQLLSKKDDLWLGLSLDEKGKLYQWSNGKPLGIRNWAQNEPSVQIGQRCVYADRDNDWFTIVCSDLKYVVCFYKAHGFSRPGTGTLADFFNADRICRETGGQLPVIILPDDWDRLSVKGFEQFWLGLIEHNDQFTWITGEHVGFYDWKGIDRGRLAHSHHNAVFPFVTLHAPEEANKVNAPRPFFCQNKTTRKEYFGLKPYNYFRLVDRDIFPLASPRSEIYVRRGSHCAVICAHDGGCFMYTANGTICRTYGNMEYMRIVVGEGVPLYQRLIALSKM